METCSLNVTEFIKSFIFSRIECIAELNRTFNITILNPVSHHFQGFCLRKFKSAFKQKTKEIPTEELNERRKYARLTIGCPSPASDREISRFGGSPGLTLDILH